MIWRSCGAVALVAALALCTVAPATAGSSTPTLTLAKTRSEVNRALKSRFGSAFTQRRDYSRECSRLTRVRIRCKVSWHTTTSRYRGSVTVSAVDEDTLESKVRVKRTAIPKPEPKPEPRSDCDPSYPTVCIPSPPPDLDCPDISQRDFAVRGSDPHGFDGDNDGVGCES